ncbi:hypothetical protein F66182_6417 [Fusarium sp. NRRL 66182]|nr:hypothetical protein F66182_6417 [Fusarium sp. NRRL 66182]
MSIDHQQDSLSMSSETVGNDDIVNSNTPSVEPKSLENENPPVLPRPSRIYSHAQDISQEILDQNYPGNGTVESPYRINFLPNDVQNALVLLWWKKWAFVGLQSLATLATTFASSAYSGGINQVIRSFGISQELATLGISLYVLGFEFGPLIWAPLSELYGRRKVFFFTFMAATAFSAGAAGAGSAASLLVLRFLAGSIGSAPLSNAPAVIADMFDKSERGMAMCMFSGAPFLGPAIGPIAGGFLGQAEGWRWLHGLMAMFTGATWILSTIFIPETYAPYILRKRAQHLWTHTGNTYISTLDADKPPSSATHQLKHALTRPWLLLFKEPIVFITSIYMLIDPPLNQDFGNQDSHPLLQVSQACTELERLLAGLRPPTYAESTPSAFSYATAAPPRLRTTQLLIALSCYLKIVSIYGIIFSKVLDCLSATSKTSTAAYQKPPVTLYVGGMPIPSNETLSGNILVHLVEHDLHQIEQLMGLPEHYRVSSTAKDGKDGELGLFSSQHSQSLLNAAIQLGEDRDGNHDDIRCVRALKIVMRQIKDF